MEDLDFDQVATLLSELSQPSAMPKLTGGRKGSNAFDANEIDFASSAWLARIVEVATWLNLDATFEQQDSPKSVAIKLFDELSLGKAEASFQMEDGHVLLTEMGAQTLGERLSRAVSNRANFLQMLDEELSVAAATEAWIDAWNEAPPTEPLSINAKVDKWRINELAGIAELGELDLNPSYQRDFVWSNADSQMLIESILRGIPLPSIILARVSNSSSFQIVDGKQRLTAILRFMGKHPEGMENAKRMKEPQLFSTNFGLFARRNNLRATEVRENYFPFKTKKYPADDPLAPLGGNYYCDIRDQKVRIAGESVSVGNLFERAAGDYFIPVLIYRDTLVRDIHKVFRLYNQQGMKLNAEEIRNAVFNHLMISRLMLFVSGDRPEPEIAPELIEAGIDPTTAHENIKALGFGITRFRRTKVLLWTVATLILKPAQGPDSAYRTPSTASHIDEFLRSIDDKRLAQFRSKGALENLANDLIAALELHQLSSDAWHPKFRRKGKSEMASRWEELPVVASLLACLILVITRQEPKLEQGIDEVRDLTSKMVGPQSTQNKTQWAHIANASTSILETLGVSMADADATVRDRYGDSAIDALLEIRKIPMI
ncbi:DUF262 domain-containing protein [Mesorhizobium mediterraneum]|uniref:GmrSD restriction endonucleases N-terminal domain-containing protein n=1 Tax=Mesorhizobium mediterraneum TaxID=43617 RepID=A0AB36RC39_9HYPH|nr:DUF262 domain-containing protein [Mesorhizobium mediterraneum]PAQ02005.1 hypothetical protein CIT25_11360 [Mesorhizobium mediterraneum]WIW54221.1 DUF262 domain-containing protein [Mesorhizobium mediterraneum]